MILKNVTIYRIQQSGRRRERMEKYISKYKYNEYNLALKKRMLAFDKFIGVHGQ